MRDTDAASAAGAEIRLTAGHRRVLTSAAMFGAATVLALAATLAVTVIV